MMILIALGIVLLVGYGVLPASIGSVGLLAVLVVSGLGLRLVKLFAGGLMIFFSFL